MTHSECVNKAHSAPHCEADHGPRTPGGAGFCGLSPNPDVLVSLRLCKGSRDTALCTPLLRGGRALRLRSQTLHKPSFVHASRAITALSSELRVHFWRGRVSTLLSVWLSTLSSSCHFRLAVKHAVLLRHVIDSLAPLLKQVGMHKTAFVYSQISSRTTRRLGNCVVFAFTVFCYLILSAPRLKARFLKKNSRLVFHALSVALRTWDVLGPNVTSLQPCR